MPRPIPVETLEPRRLFALSLAPLGEPVPLLDLPNQASVTASPIGDDDVFLAYVKNNTLFGRILDPTGATTVAEFPISTAGQSVSPNAMDAVRDSSGNAVIAYQVISGIETDLYFARISPTGSVAAGPTIAHATTTGDQSQPALAAGPNGQIAIAYQNSPFIASMMGINVNVRVFNASNAPLFAEKPINVSVAPASQFFAYPDLFFNPATAEYVATWRTQDFTIGMLPAGQTLHVRTFQPDGDLGTGPHPLATDPDDTLNRPLLFLDPTTGTPVAAFGQIVITGGNYERSELHAFTLSPTGVPTPTPFAFPDATLPDQFFPFSVVATPNDTFTFLSRSLTHGGSNSTIKAVTTDAAGNVLGTTESVLPTGQFLEPLFIPTTPGSFLAINPIQTMTMLPGPVPIPMPGDIEVSAQVLTMGGLAVDNRPTVTLSATHVTRSRGGAQPADVVVTATLSKTTNEDVVILIDTREDLSTSTAYPGTTAIITVPKGQLSASTQIVVLRYSPTATDGTVVIEADSISGCQPFADHLLTANISSAANPNTVKTTAKPGKPATVADPDGTLAKISTSAGQIDISTDANGNLVFKSSKTNGQTKITILPLSGGTGDDRFNIQNFTSQTPLFSLNAPTTDIAGNLQFNGITTLTTGDIPDDHTITLGPVKDAVLKFGSVVDAKLTAKGSIKSLSVVEWLNGSITATSIAKLTSAGDFDADLTLTSLGTLTVTGALGGATAADPAKLRATQSLGTITAGSLRNALLLAGAKPSVKTLPAKRSAFNNLKATLTSLTLKGPSPTFSNTIIAAPLIGTLKLAGVTSTNPTPHGVTALSIKSYSNPPTTAKDVTKPKLIETKDQFTARTI